jgi:hypothetical protein
VRPFSGVARVSCRGYSLGLQRAVTDLAADVSFAAAVCKVREHYGVEVSESAARALTERHGAAMQEGAEVRARMPAGGVRQMIAEMDGSLAPVVEVKEGTGDGRKRRAVGWREAKLCLARAAGCAQSRYGATLGGVGEAGRLWRSAAISAGAGRRTAVHCLGDGAKWIVTQAAAQFGTQATYLLDFYHVSEYLAAAGQAISGGDAGAWLRRQQERLKANQAQAVLAELGAHEEAAEVADAEAPVRRCARYIGERLNYSDYQGALSAGLPIGSGEIESGHRSVVQARLKLSGAWWREENAEKMLALRTCRANQEWQAYWKQARQAPA